MQRSLLASSSPVSSPEYSFANQELDYALFRPEWPVTFAAAALQKAEITYDEESKQWLGLANHSTPIIAIIGSGAGADAKPFLELGCIVYAIEPNHELRQLAIKKFSAQYRSFFSIDGNAHTLNLPVNIKVDVIVCAQALHTFSSETTGFVSSEGLARLRWKAVLPDDNKNRISIWYYNLDAVNSAVVSLDYALKQSSAVYAKSKTPFLNPPMFEPEKFLHYMEERDMCVSTAQPVDHAVLTAETFIRWLRSYSFYPKNQSEEDSVKAAMRVWFDANKNPRGEIEWDYIGYIAQGPLRATPYFQLIHSTPLVASPISQAARLAQKEEGVGFWPASKSQPQLVIVGKL